VEKESIFNNLFQQLEKMEESREVDISVINTLDNLIGTCKKIEQSWIENEEIPIESSFLLYHASRNSRLVLEKMKHRFIKASETHENPKIVNDSMLVAPILGGLCDLMFSLTKRAITPEIHLFVSKRLGLLRNTASNVSLLPSPEEEMKSVNRKKLKTRFSRFADTLQAMFIES